MKAEHRQQPKLGKNQSIAEALYFDWNDPSRHNINAPSQKHSSLKGIKNERPAIRIDLVADLFHANNQRSSYIQFTKRFTFGHPMKWYHHKHIKDVMVYIDQNFPALLWIAQKSKAYLIDLTYATVTMSDLEFQLSSKREHYNIVRYFEEQFGLVFDSDKEKKDYYDLFNDYHNYHRLKQHYPPYFSKLITHYMGQETSSSVGKNRQVKEVLKTVQKIAGEVSDLNMDAMRQILSVRDQKVHGKINEAVMTVGEIIDFMKIASCNQNLKAIFENYAGVSMKNRLDYTVPLMEESRFIDFLKQEQHEKEDVIEGWAKELRGPLSFYSFCTHLISKKWNYLALIPEPNRDLSLIDYYIYSSHNTYLSGNQLTSDSKVERYMEDLKNGIKCMEIDIHEQKGEPIVTHAIKGMFLNHAVLFDDVIKEIGSFCQRNQGFDPLILSMEDHTTGESKKKVVKTLSKYLQKYLFTIDSENELKSISLGQLKGKIIVKSASDIGSVTKNRENKQDAEQKMKEVNNKTQASNGALKVQNNNLTVEKNSNHEVSSRTSVSDMAHVTGMFKSSGINNDKSTSYECTSVDSNALMKMKQSVCQAYCRRSFLRVYPVASSIGSANYDPVPALARGAQIIALNSQTKDDGAWMMMSFFTAGSDRRQTRLGYIEKPVWLRTEQEKDNRLRKIQLTILSKKFDVKIKFLGSEEDRRRNKDSHYCFTVRDYCQGFLMFQIENLRDCIPTRFIRDGYRVVTGRNNNYHDCGVRVLMKVKVSIIPYY